MSRNCATKASIIIDNEELEQVDEFEYLGQIVILDAKTDKEIRLRVGIAKSQFQEMKVALTNRRISHALRLRLCKCFVLSTFIYDRET